MLTYLQGNDVFAFFLSDTIDMSEPTSTQRCPDLEIIDRPLTSRTIHNAKKILFRLDLRWTSVGAFRSTGRLIEMIGDQISITWSGTRCCCHRRRAFSIVFMGLFRLTAGKVLPKNSTLSQIDHLPDTHEGIGRFSTLRCVRMFRDDGFIEQSGECSSRDEGQEQESFNRLSCSSLFRAKETPRPIESLGATCHCQFYEKHSPEEERSKSNRGYFSIDEIDEKQW